MDEPKLSPEIVAWIVTWQEQDASQTRVPALQVVAMRFADAPEPAVAWTLGLIRRALAAGFSPWALAAAREIVAREPDEAEAPLFLCAILLRLGQPEAGRWLQHCLAHCLRPSLGWIEIGEVLLDGGKKEAALLCFGKGLIDASLAIRGGLLARELGSLKEAQDWFMRSVQLDPAGERGWFLLGTVAQDNRDFTAAAEAYRTVLKLNPGRAEAEVNLGLVLQETGSLDDAKRSYARAVRSRPNTFGRVAQALSGSPKGELWLDLAALHRELAG